MNLTNMKCLINPDRKRIIQLLENELDEIDTLESKLFAEQIDTKYVVKFQDRIIELLGIICSEAKEKITIWHIIAVDQVMAIKSGIYRTAMAQMERMATLN